MCVCGTDQLETWGWLENRSTLSLVRLEAAPPSSVMRENSLLRLVTLPRSLDSENTSAHQPHFKQHSVSEFHFYFLRPTLQITTVSNEQKPPATSGRATEGVCVWGGAVSGTDRPAQVMHVQ